MNELRGLILEDDIALNEAVRQFLSIYYTVQTVTTVAAARETLKEGQPFDFFILDKRLPDGSGLDIFEEIRASRPGAAVIIMTSDGDLDSIARALAKGVDDYVVKSEHLIQHLLVRIPVAIHGAAQRLKSIDFLERTSIKLPEMADEFNADTYRRCLEEVEAAYLKAALRAHQDNIPVTAEKLGVSRSTLFRKISELGIRRESRSAIFDDVESVAWGLR